jgi:putative spermidine/putrescine transport system permease protein
MGRLSVLTLVSWTTAFFVTLPLVVVVAAAFTSANYVAFPPVAFGTKWFALALQSPEFVSALVLSLELAASTALIATTLATGIVWSLRARNPRAYRAGITFFSLPLMVPVVLIALASLQLWASIGVARSAWLLLVGHLILTLPFALRIMNAAFSMLDPTLEMAAYALGTSQWRTFLRITLPRVFAGVAGSLALTFLLSFDDVVVAVFLAAPGVRTLPAVIFNHLDQSLSPDLLAISAVIIAISVAIILAALRFAGVATLVSPAGRGLAPRRRPQEAT